MSDPIRDSLVDSQGFLPDSDIPQTKTAQRNRKATELLRDFHSGELQRNDLMVLHALTEWAQEHNHCAPLNRDELEGIGAPISQSELSASLLRLNARGYIEIIPARDKTSGQALLLNWL